MKVGDIRKWKTVVEPSFDLFIVTQIKNGEVGYKYLKVNFTSHWPEKKLEESSIPATKLDKFLHGIESEQD